LLISASPVSSKSTGGKGLHIVAPLTPKLGWNVVKPFAKAIADALVAARPDRYTANPLKKTREGKILRLITCATSAAALPLSIIRRGPGRARRSPVRSRWDELKGLKEAAPYTAKTLPARLKAMKRDPWEAFFSTRQSITAKARKALGL